MTSAWKSGEDRLNDQLKAEIRILVGELEHADSAIIPRYWVLGCKLTEIEAEPDEKIELVGGSNYYYRSLRIFKYFPTLAKAKVYRGSLRQVLKEARKGIKGRGAVPIRYPAAAKQIRRLVENLWWRTPICDRDGLLELLELLADQLRRTQNHHSRGSHGEAADQLIAMEV
jgi:hypothetical protein